MIIYTDDKEFALKVIPELTSWKILDQENSKNYINKILPSKNIYFSEIKFSNKWQCILITKYSDQSQFDLLVNLCKENYSLPDGILCLAGSGSKFHGYRNRHWTAQSGNLHLSILKKPNKYIEKFHIGFTILSAISVVQTLDIFPEMKGRSKIKWVNDILIDNAKIGGVITQTQSQKDNVTSVILGIGLNIEKTPLIETDSFVNQATSMFEHINNEKVRFHEIFYNLIEKIEYNYELLLSGGYQTLLKNYKKRSIILNRKVEIYSDLISGGNSLIASGIVNNIGDELELYIKNIDKPIRHGRLKLF